MSLAAGTRLGPYEIEALIGAGGMGEVYKARDTRLGRTVAIKVLPPDLAADPDRRRRFEQPLVSSEGSRLVSVDLRGRVTPLSAPLRDYGAVRASPDGSRLALVVNTIDEQGVWTHDLSRPNSLTRVTRGGDVIGLPCWTPNANRITYAWNSGRGSEVVWQRAEGSGQPDVLLSRPMTPASWSRDGTHLALVGSGDTIWFVDVDSNSHTTEPQPHRKFGPTSVEGYPQFSPDGRWLVYTSHEVGEQNQTYIEPFGGGPRKQVSIDAGTDNPVWHPKGRQIFFVGPYRAGKRSMMMVDVDLASPVRVGSPRVLFEFRTTDLGFSCAGGRRCYDLAPDGQRFFVGQPVPRDPTPVTHLDIILNWFEELKAKVPVRR